MDFEPRPVRYPAKPAASPAESALSLAGKVPAWSADFEDGRNLFFGSLPYPGERAALHGDYSPAPIRFPLSGYTHGIHGASCAFGIVSST